MRSKTESEIERAHRDRAVKAGWLVEKIVLTARGGFPDRFYARNGRVVLLEWKRDNKPARRQQLLRHDELRRAGVEVYVVFDSRSADEILGLDNGNRADPDTDALDL